jgi:hypothetical protein
MECMYICMFVCAYICTYSACCLAVHILSTHHLCFMPLNNIHHFVICAVSYLVEPPSAGLPSPGHTLMALMKTVGWEGMDCRDKWQAFVNVVIKFCVP